MNDNNILKLSETLFLSYFKHGGNLSNATTRMLGDGRWGAGEGGEALNGQLFARSEKYEPNIHRILNKIRKML